MAIREGLLALLADGPRHGYQLKSSFESATGGVWPLNVGQVYTTLDRLDRDGLVSPAERHDTTTHKRFRITPAGRAELGAWWDAVPLDDEPPPRDELMLKILLVIEGDADHAQSVITEHRSALLSLLQRRRRQLQGSRSLSERLVADALTVRAEADLRWLDMCDARLTAHQKEST